MASEIIMVIILAMTAIVILSGEAGKGEKTALTSMIVVAVLYEAVAASGGGGIL